jgi:hypothetical protein
LAELWRYYESYMKVAKNRREREARDRKRKVKNDE